MQSRNTQVGGGNRKTKSLKDGSSKTRARGWVTFEGIGFEGVLRVEGVLELLRLAAERRLHFKWILLQNRSRDRQ